MILVIVLAMSLQKDTGMGISVNNYIISYNSACTIRTTTVVAVYSIMFTVCARASSPS